MSSDFNPAPFFAIPISIFFLTILLFLTLVYVFNRKRVRLLRSRQQHKEWKLPVRLEKLQPGEDLRRALQEEFDKLVEKGFQDRLEAESSKDNGERIWLSHLVSKGQLKHWVLITHDHKYELRRSRPGERGVDGADLENCQAWAIARSATGRALAKYESRIKPSTVDEGIREQAIANDKKPAVEGLYYSIIGWTNMSKSEVDDAFRSITENFGEYSLFFNNCQHFLRRFAEKIVTEKAPDWTWFIESTLKRYRYKPLTDPVALAVLQRFWQEKMRGMGGRARDDGDGLLFKRNASASKSFIEIQRSHYISSGMQCTKFDFDIGTPGCSDPATGGHSMGGGGMSSGDHGCSDSGGMSGGGCSSGSGGGCSSND